MSSTFSNNTTMLMVGTQNYRITCEARALVGNDSENGDCDCYVLDDVTGKPNACGLYLREQTTCHLIKLIRR